MNRMILLVVFMSALIGSAAVQSTDASNCSTDYENRNPIDNKPLRLSLIKGTSEIDVGTEIQPAIPGACFVLFTDKEHRFVASVRAAGGAYIA
jgi:hypothetical protein